jgi:hypothetical protein
MFSVNKCIKKESQIPESIPLFNRIKGFYFILLNFIDHPVRKSKSDR